MYSGSPQNPNQGFQYGYQEPLQKKSGPGCWLWVPVGCGSALIVLFIIFALVVHSVLHSPHSKSLVDSSGGMLRGGMEVADAGEKMKLINRKVILYRQSTGHYPPTLQALVPQYLTDGSQLHILADPNPNPAHVSFIYMKPADNAPSNTVYLTGHVDYKFTMLSINQKVNDTLTMSLDGQLNKQRLQTTVDN